MLKLHWLLEIYFIFDLSSFVNANTPILLFSIWSTFFKRLENYSMTFCVTRTCNTILIVQTVVLVSFIECYETLLHLIRGHLNAEVK